MLWVGGGGEGGEGRGLGIIIKIAVNHTFVFLFKAFSIYKKTGASLANTHYDIKY